MGRLLLPWLVYAVVTVLATPMPRAGVLGGPPSPITLAALLAGGAAQVHRYRRVSTPLQRQQTKWAMLGIAGQLVCLLALVVAVALFPALTDPGLPGLVFKRYGFAVVGLLPLLLIPVAIAVSLLRYRLWDADVVINRALV